MQERRSHIPRPRGPGYDGRVPGLIPTWPFLLLAGAAIGLLWLVLGTRRRRRRQVRQWVGRLWHAGDPDTLADLASRGQSYPSVRQLLLGRTKAEVADRLGRPPAAAANPAARGKSPGPATMTDFWQADVWYYPFDVPRELALAVTFSGGAVHNVEWLSGPASEE